MYTVSEKYVMIDKEKMVSLNAIFLLEEGSDKNIHTKKIHKKSKYSNI